MHIGLTITGPQDREPGTMSHADQNKTEGIRSSTTLFYKKFFVLNVLLCGGVKFCNFYRNTFGSICFTKVLINSEKLDAFNHKFEHFQKVHLFQKLNLLS